MSVSIFTPKAFSMRSAMSPDRSALPLSRLDKAGRETRSAAAAAVTDKPAGWMISVRMKSPGWGGFFMGIVLSSFQVVVDQFNSEAIKIATPDVCSLLSFQQESCQVEV